MVLWHYNLANTTYQPLAGGENVSHSTAYRKIRWLVEEKLLVVDKIEITENGKNQAYFEPH
jgi:Fe2+ or Zn2+ uptake regulation protein